MDSGILQKDFCVVQSARPEIRLFNDRKKASFLNMSALLQSSQHI